MYTILSLDGGGIRGVFTATFLSLLEKELGEDKKIGQYFDMISGTSTGGIIACLLSAPDKHDPDQRRYSADDALSFYLTNGSKIFDISWKKWIDSKAGLTDEKYSNEAIKELIREYGGDLRLSDMQGDCLITSYNTDTRSIQLFKSHKAKQDPEEHDYTILDVALSTSAAPTYFEPVLSEKGETLIDGGVYANNPSACAFIEAAKCAGNKKKLMLSIGTGREERSYPHEMIKDYGMIEWINPLVKILMGAGSDLNEYFAEQMFKMEDNSENYYRVNVQLEPEWSSMDRTDHVYLCKLAELARDEFNRLKELGVIDEIVAKLK